MSFGMRTSAGCYMHIIHSLSSKTDDDLDGLQTNFSQLKLANKKKNRRGDSEPGVCIIAMHTTIFVEVDVNHQ